MYVKNEITVSQEDIILEFGKSIISFRIGENLEEQISKCTFTGWNMMKAQGVTGSADTEINFHVKLSKVYRDS